MSDEMGAGTPAGQESKPRVRSTAPVEYVVLERVEVDLEPDDPWTGWREVWRGRVAAGAKRRTVLEKALAAEASLEGSSGAFMVLSAEQAAPFSVRTVVREPELVIEGGGARDAA